MRILKQCLQGQNCPRDKGVRVRTEYGGVGVGGGQDTGCGCGGRTGYGGAGVGGGQDKSLDSPPNSPNPILSPNSTSFLLMPHSVERRRIQI